MTRGSQAIEADGRGLAAAQAPLWGLGRVAMNEHPDLGCKLVDLEPSGNGFRRSTS